MGKKGGSSGPQYTESTVTQSNLPDYAEPYYHELIARGEAVSNTPYVAYPDQRIADYNPYELAAFNAYSDVFTRPLDELNTASNLAATAGTAGPMYIGGNYYLPGEVTNTFDPNEIGFEYTPQNFQSLYEANMIGAGYDPAQLDFGYTARDLSGGYSPDRLNAAYQANNYTSGYDADTFGRRLNEDYDFSASAAYDPMSTYGDVFDSEAATQYMNPYTENVMDRLQARMEEQYLQDRVMREGEAAAAGAFGGSRRHVVESLAHDDYANRVLDMEAEQLQNAYFNAQDQFERDRQARFQAEGMTDDSNRFGADLGLRAAMAGADYGINAFGQNLSAYLGEQGVRQAEEEFAQNAFGLNESAQQAMEQFRQSAYGQSEEALQARESFNQNAYQLSEAARQFQAQTGLSADMASEEFKQFAAQLGVNVDQINEQNLQLQEQMRQGAVQDQDSANRFLAEMGMSAQQATEQLQQIAAQMGMDAQQINEGNWQYYADMLMNTDLANQASYNTSLERMLGSAGLLSEIGGQEQAMDLDRIAALLGVGQSQRALEQAQMDQSYQDFVNQRDYERMQLAFLSQLLQGMPVDPQSEVIRTNTGPAPDPYSQLLSTGLGALSLNKSLNSG